MTDLKFKRTIAFQADLFKLTSDAEAILFLSQAIYWGKRTQDAEGWFYKSVVDWESELTIKAWKQREVRAFWRKIEVLEEAKMGAPPKIYFRIVSDKLQSLLNSSQAQNQDIQLRENRVIETSKTEELKARKSRNQLFGNRALNSSKTALLKRENRALLLIDTKITSEITTENTIHSDLITDVIELASENSTSRFAAFWEAYPKKVGRKPCQQKWKAKNLDKVADQILVDIGNRVQHHDPWRKGYIPNPLTYLNQERWEDEIEHAKGRNGNFKDKLYTGTHPDDISWLQED